MRISVIRYLEFSRLVFSFNWVMTKTYFDILMRSAWIILDDLDVVTSKAETKLSSVGKIEAGREEREDQGKAKGDNEMNHLRLY